MQGELCLCSFPCIPPPGFLILGESQLLISTGELRQWPRGFLAHWAKRPCRSFVFSEVLFSWVPESLASCCSLHLASPKLIAQLVSATHYCRSTSKICRHTVCTLQTVVQIALQWPYNLIQYHDKGRRPQALYELYISIYIYLYIYIYLCIYIYISLYIYII